MKGSNNSLRNLLLKIIEQNSQLIAQNQTLIEQHEVKDEIILQVLNENSELMQQVAEQGEPTSTQYLDD